jgi:hypothetical protein
MVCLFPATDADGLLATIPLCKGLNSTGEIEFLLE